ncbi:unnamed protein product [Hermetia illucens]|uniref:Mannosyltransferase n=1 Tax=Hermetia illucens TaxID=343691 RepID=A0A7R8UKI2_HERIL|nr:GPI mannosyltransferase 3 isoform X2 [Hermetia illucens]CAD7082375.1 unnamed protein product [Hermetia illucens]
MGALKIFLVFLVVRLLSVFLVTTFFVPDEYWQSLEVAHKLVFGYGFMTWEWASRIRSYLYPLVFAGFYKVLALLGYDTVELLVIGPRILQALLTAYSDYRFYVWTGKKKWSLFLLLTSYFWFYAGSRTLINTLEASLTTIALSMFPWHSERTDFLWLTAICCYIRPTAALTWLPLCIIHLKNSEHSAIELILKRYIPIGLLAGGLCIGVDSYIYGLFTVPPAQFFLYNIYENIGSFYGVHEWYWYLAVGLPTLLGISTLPFLFAVINTILNWNAFPIRKALLISILFTLAGLSFIEHKEHRFLLIILPMCLYICSDYLSRWSTRANSLLVWLFAAAIIAGNAAPGWYFSTVHQKGTLEVMKPLAKIAESYRDKDNNPARLLFLMPCHSTPFYSHIHQNITMYFVECDPHNDKDYQIFNNDPERWLRMKVPAMPLSRVPSHVVLYNTLVPRVRTFLSRYRKIERIHHTDYPVSNTGTYIHTYEINLEEEYERQFVEDPVASSPSHSGHDEL